MSNARSYDRAVSAGQRDAEEIESPVHAPRVVPRNAWVWVRIRGAWRRGAIHHWWRLDDGWAALLQYPDPDGGPWAKWATVVHDGVTMVPRAGAYERRPPE